MYWRLCYRIVVAEIQSIELISFLKLCFFFLSFYHFSFVKFTLLLLLWVIIFWSFLITNWLSYLLCRFSQLVIAIFDINFKVCVWRIDIRFVKFVKEKTGGEITEFINSVKYWKIFTLGTFSKSWPRVQKFWPPMPDILSNFWRCFCQSFTCSDRK